MTTTTGQQIAAAGAPLTLPNTHPVRVRFSFRALMQLEQQFGGLGNIQTAMDGSGVTLGPLLQMLAAGLLREHDGAGAPLTYDRLADLLDDAAPADVQTFLAAAGEAVGVALVEAFPTAAKDAVGNDQAQVAAPGLTGTTPALSSSDVPTTSSG